MSDVKAGGAYVLVQARDELTKQLNAMESRFKAFGSAIGNAGKKVAAVGATMGAGFALAVKHFEGAGSKLTDLSARTKVSVETLSRLGFAASQVGAGIGDVSAALRVMQRTLFEAEGGGAEALETLTALGVTLSDLQGLSAGEKFTKIAEALGAVDDDTRQAGLAMKIFGRGAQALIPLIEDGAAELKKFEKISDKVGATMSKADADAADELGDAMTTLNAAVGALANRVGAALAPSLTDIADRITSVTVKTGEWARNNQPLVQNLAAVSLGVAGLGTAMTVLEPTISAVGAAIGTLPVAFAILSNPVGLTVAALGTATAAFLAFTETGQKTSQQIGAGIVDGFKSAAGQLQIAMDDIAQSLKRGQIENAAKLAFASLEVIFQEGWARIKAMAFEGGVSTVAGWTQSFLDFMDTPLPVLLHGEAGVHEDNRAAWEKQKQDMAEQWKSIADLNQAGMAKAVAAALSAPEVQAARQRLEQLRNEIGQANAKIDATVAAAAEEQARKRGEDRLNQRMADLIRRAPGGDTSALALPDGAAASAVPNFGSQFDGEGVADAIKDLAVRDNAVGTFSGLIAEQLVGASGPEERTAKAAEATAKHTKRIADASRNGGLVFA